MHTAKAATSLHNVNRAGDLRLCGGPGSVKLAAGARGTMKRRFQLRAFAVLLGLVFLLPNTAHRAFSQQPARAANAPPVHIYMMRGLLGIFSLGIDSLAKRLRAQGFDPQILGWDQWGQIAGEILDNARGGDTGQIILIGHSLGSNSTIEVANAIRQQNIPVDLIVTFDITQPLQVPRNVVRFINFYQRNGFGERAVPGYGFTGELTNIDLTSDTSIGHGNIDEIPRLQQAVVDKVLELTVQQTKKVPERRKNKRPQG
jgi:hypothetical protein